MAGPENPGGAASVPGTDGRRQTVSWGEGLGLHVAELFCHVLDSRLRGNDGVA